MTSKSKNQQEQKMLEEFMKLKPTRAIDRLLTEHSIDKVYLLYNTLQQKIRKNTSELRITLTDKYEHLVDCSNLLTTIQQFTEQIQEIAHNINHTFQQQNIIQHQSSKKTTTRPIKLVQQCIHHKKYTEAMRLIQMSIQSAGSFSENELLYLPYLKIEILEALQKELISKKLNQRFISEIICCLKIYLTSLKTKEREQLLSNSFQQDSLLFLIVRHLSQKSENMDSTQSQILEIVFKCKLFSLNRLITDTNKGEQISKFFHDIYQLINEQDRQPNTLTPSQPNSNLLIPRNEMSLLTPRHPLGFVEATRHLASIFCQNLTQIQMHLSETFIVCSQDQIISFRYDLYEQLLSAEEFIQNLDMLHRIISDKCPNAPKVSLKQSFINLWYNYYHQLLKILFKKCSPHQRLPTVASLNCNIPLQLDKYIVVDEQSASVHLNLYRKQLQLFFTNINQLVSKSQNFKSKNINSETVLEDIVKMYTQKIRQMNSNVHQKIEQLGNYPSEFNLHSTILMFFLCEEFNCYLKDTSFNHLEQIKQYKLQWNYTAIEKYCSIFQFGKTKNWYTNFDNFFMNYSHFISSQKLSILKDIILILIQSKMRVLEPEISRSLIQQCKRKKEKQQKQRKQREGKLKDLKPSAIGPTTFAKKKNVSIS